MIRLVLLAAALALPAAAQTPLSVVEEATPGVRYRRPVGVEMAPGQPARLYVIEKGIPDRPARIVTLVPGDAESTVFLDLTDKVFSDSEGGLLGLAFHPDYDTNGRLFVYYTAPVDDPVFGVRVIVSHVSEFARSETDPLRADPASERVLLEVDQPEDYHNAGTVDFGPDGMLYVSLGDGGGVGDPRGHGQDPTTLLGSILRIDVDDVPAGALYGIPDDNPFAATDGPERDEIFAYGFRNPFKFDAGAFGVWVGDVGAGKWEEVNSVEAGGNYGWSDVEGPECYCPNGQTCDPCDPTAYEAPVIAYPHGPEFGNSITGGFVMEDPDSALYGTYLYGDFVTGRLWGLRVGETEPVVLRETFPYAAGGEGPINIVSIDPAPEGNVFVTDHFGGMIYRLITPRTPVEPAPERPRPTVERVGPNPFRESTAVRVDWGRPVHVTLYDALGREVAVLWDGPASRRTINVDGTRLAPGAYSVVATDGEVASSFRLIRVP